MLSLIKSALGLQDSIPDEVIRSFEDRRKHAFEKIKWCIPDDLKGPGKTFLDIGCGIGNGVVAALQHGYRAVGIDRDLNEFDWFKPEYLKDMARRYNVSLKNARLIEGDLFETELPTFDVVFMLDSIEHVPDPMRFIDKAASLVAPHGALLIDTCPLYYGPAGGHLFNEFPTDTIPWVHLRQDFDTLCREKGVTEWSMQRYHELNKVTHQQIRDRVISNGLTVTLEHRSAETPELREKLEANRQFLNLDGLDESLLFEDWILIVARRL